MSHSGQCLIASAIQLIHCPNDCASAPLDTWLVWWTVALQKRTPSNIITSWEPTLSRHLYLPLTANMWINGAGFIAPSPVFIFSAERLRVLMYVDFISDEWLFDCSFCLRFMALSLSPDCSATLIFNKRDEDINQVLLAALTKTLNVLYGVSKHASHASLSQSRVREGQKVASTEEKKKPSLYLS